MARTKTPKTANAEQASASAPVIVESAAPVVAEKKVKAPKAPKAEAASVAPVVASIAPVVAPVEDVLVAAADGETPLADQSVEFLAKLQQLGVLISSLKA